MEEIDIGTWLGIREDINSNFDATAETYDSITLLKAASCADGDTAILLGYAEPGDGGHGLFVCNGVDDLSAEVAADTESGVYAQGVGGVWVRADTSVIKPNYFATDDGAREYVKNQSNEAVVENIVNNVLIGTLDLPSGTSRRDAFQVSRLIDGLTDCHAFSDKTLIENATDTGTYGTFDSQTEIGGTEDHSHQYSYQDRAEFSGSGTLVHWGNIITPKLSGSGTVTERIDININDVNISDTGSVSSHIGILIDDLVADSPPVAINSAQSTGYMLYASGGAKSYHKGSLILGAVGTDNSLPFTVSGDNATDKQFYIDTGNTAATMGVIADAPIYFINNFATRLILNSSTNSYGLSPGEDNAQPLGLSSKRWAIVYSATAAISTSDEREKTFLEVSEAETLVAKELKSVLRKFKFNNSIEEKGFDAARIHWGIGAQTVKATFEKYGLVAEDYGMLCYDEWTADENTEAGNLYGIRYEELLCFIVSAL